MAPSITASENPATFHPFSRLSAELRNAIWTEAANAIRHVVEIIEEKPTVNSPSRSSIKYRIRDAGHPEAVGKVPSILHVNFESRQVGLKIWSLEFQGILKNPVYFNFDRDTLLIGDDEAMKTLLDTETEPIPYCCDIKVLLLARKLRHVELRGSGAGYRGFLRLCRYLKTARIASEAHASEETLNKLMRGYCWFWGALRRNDVNHVKPDLYRDFRAPSEEEKVLIGNCMVFFLSPDGTALMKAKEVS